MKNKIIYKDDYVIMLIERRNGDVFEVLISKESVTKLEKYPYKWYVWHNWSNNSYYVVSTEYQGIDENGKPRYRTVRLNRFLVDAKDGEYVDHINHNTLDNRLENLRITNNQNNVRHRKGANKNNKTGIRNVTWDKRINKYIVQLQINGKNTRLGEFDDLNEAAKFAEKMRKKYYKEFA
jgi:hypothetical protein